VVKSVYCIAVCAGLALCAAAPVRATEDVAFAYQVQITPSGDRELDDALRLSAELEMLRRTAPASPFAVILRARQDVERLRPVLDSFGYYGARINITINGQSVDDSSLSTRLQAVPAGSEAQVLVDIEYGPGYTLRDVVVAGALPEGMRELLAVEPGVPAIARDVLAGRDRLLTALRQQGYAFAEVDVPIAYVIADAPVIDLHIPVRAGAQVSLGEITVTGLERTEPDVVRSRLQVRRGERYDPRRLDEARRGLLELGVFAGVTVRTADRVDEQGLLPVTFQVSERKRHAVKINADYASDQGGSAGVSWTDRNLRRGAEQLDIAVSAINLGGRASTSLGYNARAELLVPDAERPQQSFRYELAALTQSLQAYDITSAAAGAQLRRRLSQWWTASAGLRLQRARIEQQGVTNDYTLLAFPIAGLYDTTREDSPLGDPVSGWRGAMTLAPSQSLGEPRATFIVLQASIARYLDLSRGDDASGRSVLALRALAGNAYGAGQFSLPPDQRFYGGGSATVRGHRYQSIGPKFADGSPAGGTAIAAATAEFRQRIGASFGAAVFVDAGQVTVGAQPFRGKWSVGAGAGVRYYTLLGPIRFDVAVPIQRPADSSGFEIYIGLGQAF
jgi:translocation and assembly module TamA